ncbi:unnamed protein product [Hymenolepis diminuta]|uniref:SH2 domain-containing protein n=1 Tax=Hymenolepis diminuta TaxID=6216 RepID=A0A564XYV5_HYMDI|nr:unnamed protein product [Hymenolepis diminuta]
MDTTYSEFGIQDTDNVILYPAPNFMQPAGEHVRERVGEVRSPPTSRIYRTEQTIIPENRLNNSGYSREYQEKIFRGGFSQDPRMTAENYVPSTEGATSSRNYSLSNGISESYTSSTRFNHVNQNSSYSFHPRGSIRETSLRVDSGLDGPTEWSRREESIRETGESQLSHTSDLQGGSRFVTSPVPPSQSAQSAPLNGFSPLPPFPNLNTPSASSSFRVTRKPPVVSRNGDSEIVTTEEMKKEDDTTETIIQRRTIRRKRVPTSRLSSRNGDTSEEIQRSASYNIQKRIENAANDAFGKSPTPVRTRLQTETEEYVPRSPLINRNNSGAPPRTYSQTNIHQYSNTLRNQWSSENNLHVGSYLKQAPIRGTYSAHQENLRRRNELNQHSEHLRSSRRMSETGYGEICQEIVSLLPIGRGIQDLESGSNAATLPRAGSQTAGRSYSAGVGNRGQYYSGTQSPALSRQHGGRVVSEHRSRTVQNESHWSNYNGLGSSTGSLHGGSYTAGQGQTNHMALDTIDSRHMLSSDMSFHWFRPNATRQEATQMLINKEPGRFIIRTSKSQPDCYALVVRVPITADDSEPVRTFLLNRVKGGDAVHLRGFESEPIFPSLSAFVHDHTIHQGVLPVLLKVPMRSALSSSYLAGGTASPSVGRYSTAGTDFSTDVLYLGSVDVFPLQGESAVKRAVEQVLSQANNPLKGLKKKCEATVMCSINKGITIVDKNSTRFTKKSIPANKILYCSYDPDERVFNAIELKNRGVADSQIFAIVVKKTRFTMTEHAVYVMCQLEPHQPSSSLINFINQNLPVHYR